MIDYIRVYRIMSYHDRLAAGLCVPLDERIWWPRIIAERPVLWTWRRMHEMTAVVWPSG